MVLGCISRINATHSRVKATTQDGCQTGLLKTLLVSPLPAVFEMCHVLRLIVSSVQVIHTCLQTGFHNGQVLIRKCHIDDNLRLELIEQSHQFVYIVGIHLRSLDVRITDSLHNVVTLCLRTACNHHVCKHVRILCYFVRHNGSNTTCANN